MQHHVFFHDVYAKKDISVVAAQALYRVLTICADLDWFCRECGVILS